MIARKTVSGFLVAVAILAMGFVIGTASEFRQENPTQVADRYHARNRTSSFFERAGTSVTRGTVATRVTGSRSNPVTARSLRRR